MALQRLNDIPVPGRRPARPAQDPGPDVSVSPRSGGPDNTLLDAGTNIDHADRSGTGRSRRTPEEKAERAEKKTRKALAEWPADPDPDLDPPELTGERRAALVRRGTELCVWYLSNSGKSRSELAGVLRRKNLPADLVDEVLGSLEHAGYVDDAGLAEQFVRTRSEYRLLGSTAIRHELLRKGVDAEVVDEALAGVDEDSEQARARILADQQVRRTRGTDRNKRVQRLAGMLARKGYPSSVVFTVARAAVDADVTAETDGA